MKRQTNTRIRYDKHFSSRCARSHLAYAHPKRRNPWRCPPRRPGFGNSRNSLAVREKIGFGVRSALPDDRSGARWKSDCGYGRSVSSMTFYMGSTGGGIWETTDAGLNWKNTSDGQLPVGSMGAIEVSLSDRQLSTQARARPRSGATCPLDAAFTNPPTLGKHGHSADYGVPARLLPFALIRTTRTIVYVGSVTRSQANKHRDVFRSSDGGKTWSNVLHLSDELGAADIELQPVRSL